MYQWMERGKQKLMLLPNCSTLRYSCGQIWDVIQFLFLMDITSCLCLWAGLHISVNYWQQSTAVQLKIVTHRLQSNKLSTVLNFFPLFRLLWEIISYISVPLRFLLKSCQSVQSNSDWWCPISVTRQAREQYSSQKQWSTVEILSILSLCGLWMFRSGFTHVATKLSPYKV